MKKFAIISILVSVISLVAFGYYRASMSDNRVKSKEGFVYRVYVIDKCEYISYDRGISHKGNCTNSFHKIPKI